MHADVSAVFTGLFLCVSLIVRAPWLITVLSSAVAGQELPVSPSSSAPPKPCCVAGTVLHGVQTGNAPHSSH